MSRLHTAVGLLSICAVASALHAGISPWSRLVSAQQPPTGQPPPRMLQTSESLEMTGGIPGLHYGASILSGAPCLEAKIAAMSEHDTHAIDLYHDQLIQSTQYTGQRCKGLLRLALEVAYLAHNGQLRKSGEAYITHPVAVAAILAESRLDIETVVSGLLHDTVEDTELTFEDVHRLFGGDVRRIVEGETKVSKLPKMVRTELEAERLSSGNLARTRNAVVQTTALNKQDEQVENLRSMFVAMAEDWRIVVVKLADRLHNMRTLEFMPPHKRISIARETLEIFAPLAHRLGVRALPLDLRTTSTLFLSLSSRAVSAPSCWLDSSCPFRTTLRSWATVSSRLHAAPPPP